MDVHSLVKQLSVDIGSPGLALNAQGMARLSFDGRWAIDMEWDEQRRVLHLYALAGQLPVEGRETLLMGLLSANLLGLETAGASFAVDPETDEVLLCTRVDPETVSFECFRSILENMLATLEQQVPKIFKSVMDGESVLQTTSVDNRAEFFMRA